MTGEMTTGNVTSYPAAADLSAKQFFGMLLDSNGRVNVADTQTAVAQWVGVLQNKPDALGKAASIQYTGRTKIVAGGTFSIGDHLAIASDGQFVVAATGNLVVAVAVKAGADGEVSEAQIISSFAEP